jgi:hypothetical protein
MGLVDKLIGLPIELMLLIAYIREKQGANQDKSRMGDAGESTRGDLKKSGFPSTRE